jgi:hypothetical protein
MNGEFLSSKRRSFLTRIGTRIAPLTAMAGVAFAKQKSSGDSPWRAARHEKDDWLDIPHVKHRLVFDTISADALGDALAFALNFSAMNRAEYGLENSDLAVVIVVRHRSTAFGYSDSMWAKYGTTLAARSKVDDPKTKLPPKVNLYNSTDYGELMPNRGITLEALSKLGVQFAVCSLATHAYAGMIAQQTGSKADAIFSELTGNLVSNARMVPAGIVAVSRAQERNYTLVSA